MADRDADELNIDNVIKKLLKGNCCMWIKQKTSVLCKFSALRWFWVKNQWMFFSEKVILCLFVFSSGREAWYECSVNRDRNQRALSEITWNIFVTANITGTWSPVENMRWVKYKKHYILSQVGTRKCNAFFHFLIRLTFKMHL